MLRKFRVLILLALAALAWNVTPAYSTTLTTYTDLSSYQAASTGNLLADFEALTPGYYNTSTGVSNYSNVDFIGYNSVPAPFLQVVNTTGSPYYDFGTGNALMVDMDRPTVGTPPLPYIHVVFTAPVTAFAADLFTNSPRAMSFAITVLGTQYVAATNAAAPATFWGLTSDTPISSVDFTIQGTAAQGGTTGFLDNFRYGTAQTGSSGNPSDTPEAATLVLIGSGLIGLAGLRKRIKPAEPA